MVPGAAEAATALIAGDWIDVVARCADDDPFADAIASEVAALLASRAQPVPPDGQAGILALLAVSGHRPLNTVIDALWDLPGAEGAGWLVRLLPRHDSAVSFRFQDMYSGKRPPWSVEDWIARLDALSEANLAERFSLLGVFGGAQPPRETAPAQVRFARTYAGAETDYLVRMVVRNLREYGGNDPAQDAGLYWWSEPDELLRWIVELSQPPGVRQAVVAAARETGAIDEAAAAMLVAPLDRPAWADRVVPWKVTEVVDAGTVHLPDGDLAAADPYWAFEGLDFEIMLSPGTYPVSIVRASHPLFPTQNGAAELAVDAATPARWELVGAYTVEVGVGSFGAVEVLTQREKDLLPPGGVATAGTQQVDGGDAGSLVMFDVGPQRQTCRTWVGRDTDGRIVRVLTDLGLLGLDPLQAPPAEPLTPISGYEPSPGWRGGLTNW